MLPRADNHIAFCGNIYKRKNLKDERKMITPDYYEYRIKPGESLSLIVAKFYGIGPRSPQYQKCLQNILAINPHIKNANLIREGSLLRLLPTPLSAMEKPITLNRQPVIPTLLRRPSESVISADTPEFLLDGVSKEDEINFHLLSLLAARSEMPLFGANLAQGMITGLINPRVNRILPEINNLYVDYKAGKLTKGQYDYRRKLKIQELKAAIGPVDRFLFGTSTNNAIRIARGGGVPATSYITKHSNHLKKVASYGKYGGYVLAGASVAAGCMQIADTDSRQEKNEIFVETVTGTTAGLFLSAAVTIFLVSNPVGWGTALVIGAGSAAAAYTAGKVTRKAYTVSGASVDFVSGMGVDKVCK